MNIDAHQHITSKKHANIKLALALHKKRARDQTGLFFIEGFRELVRAVDNGVKLHSLFINEAYRIESNLEHLVAKANAENENLDIATVADSVNSSICYRANSEIAAVAHKHDIALEDLRVPKNVFIVICSGLEKPGNLGAVMRSADAVGVHAVIVANPVLDVFNPNVVRASIGTLFTTPVVIAHVESALQWLGQQSINVVAAHPSVHTHYAVYSYPNRVAIVIGNEAHGLHQRWLERARDTVSIPQLGQADSLNTAMSATVILYEVLRQRTLEPLSGKFQSPNHDG